MTSMSGITVFCLLLLRLTALGDDMQCSVVPAGALHPVQALLEQFEAGLGCAARESGNKETRVITVGDLRNQSDNKVALVLKRSRLSLSPPRSLRLLLSSKTPIRWVLESDRLPSDLRVLVQVSPKSSVESDTLRLSIQPVPLLPTRPRALLRWALKRHGGLSSLTHLTRGNRVYLQLGDDPNLPAVCQLQSTFLSESYVTSDLRPQQVLGCVLEDSAQVHVVKLHSAGSSLCSSLQVEVIVSLLPPVATSPPQQVVLILSSSAPVNWAVVAHGVQGHVVVHSSNSVSPPYPPEPDLTLSTTLVPDLSHVPDLLLWARDHGYSEVTSYTEASLANRFVIQLAGGGAVPDVSSDVVPGLRPRAARPSWAEEQRLRSEESFTVQCEDGRLSVTVDKVVLQSLSVPVSAVTLQDPACQAQSNGSHFLLVFPVISCGTEGLLQDRPRGVRYQNMVLLWRDKPKTTWTGRRSKSPLGIHFTCSAPDPSTLHPDPHDEDEEHEDLLSWSAVDLLPKPGLSRPPTLRPHLDLELFVTEDYEKGHSAPCVVTADHRVYAKISAEGLGVDSARVTSCVVSAHSDPKISPVWDVISHGCSSEPSLILVEAEEEDEEEEGGDEEMSRREAGRSLRFSFIVRPVYNDPMQFLHCSLRLCVSDSSREEEHTEGGEKMECQDGRPVPPLVSRSPKHKSLCETRTLSRPMVVTPPAGWITQKAPVVQRAKRLSLLSAPDQDVSLDHNPVIRTGPVMGIVFAAFLLGVGLMVVLWCIYTHTDDDQRRS